MSKRPAMQPRSPIAFNDEGVREAVDWTHPVDHLEPVVEVERLAETETITAALLTYLRAGRTSKAVHMRVESLCAAIKLDEDNSAKGLSRRMFCSERKAFYAIRHAKTRFNL